jgi:hypothetical protein
MHLVIPFAAPLSEAGRQAAASLRLPHLEALLQRLAEVQRDCGDEWSLSPPHERALARALGWQLGDGRLPWAARAARAAGIATGDDAWGLITPAHGVVGTDQVSLVDPGGLMLDEATSRQLFDAVAGLFTSEGHALHHGGAGRWYLAHESLAGLATASLDRVIGRNVDAWLGPSRAAPHLRRLLSEAQMLMYTHPLNEQRQELGLLPVNTFWLSACGVAQPETAPAPAVDDRLRAPALAADWAAWARAWETLDEGPLAALLQCAQRGEPLRLTLCGERAAACFEPLPRSLLQRLRARLAPPRLPLLLESL